MRDVLQIDPATWWTAMASAFLIGFAVAALPIGAAEVAVLAIAALPSPRLQIAVLVIFTAGHVLGKLLWYALGRLEVHVRHPRARRWIDSARGVAAAHPHAGASVTFASASVSIPPFHLLAIAAGIVRAPIAGFVAVAFAGRLLRFAVIAGIPALLRIW